MAGIDHEGTRISFNPPSVRRADAEALAERYREGKGVAVDHHPSRPDLCTLERGATPFAWVIAGVGAAVLAFALGLLSGRIVVTPAGPDRGGATAKP